MKTEIRNNKIGYWDLMVDGVIVLHDESWAVCNNVADMVGSGEIDHSECGEVAIGIIGRSG